MKFPNFLTTIVNAVLGPPEERAARRAENELRDELEAAIGRSGSYSSAHVMMLAGVAISHGKLRAASHGVPLRKATFDLLYDLVNATGSLPVALRHLESTHNGGWKYLPTPPLNRGNLILVLDDMNHCWSIEDTTTVLSGLRARQR